MKRILVVDDEPAFVRITTLNLEAIGAYTVFTESKGSRVVEAARECRPDLIFLDIMMPDMMGGDVAAALHNDPELRHIKVVYVTSLLKKGEEKRSGPNMVLAKPVNAEELVAIIEQELSRPVSHSMA